MLAPHWALNAAAIHSQCKFRKIKAYIIIIILLLLIRSKTLSSYNVDCRPGRFPAEATHSTRRLAHSVEFTVTPEMMSAD